MRRKTTPPMDATQASDGKKLPRRKYDRALVQIRLKRELHAKVKQAAAKEDMPVAAWIRRLCVAAIGRAASSPAN